MQKPVILGVVNVSPESRQDHSIATDKDSILKRAAFLKKNNAKYIDIGARASTNRKIKIDDKTEQKRLIPAIKALKERGYRISVDTWSEDTAIKCLGQGVEMINFTSSQYTPKLLKALSKYNAWVVIVYMPYINPYNIDTSKARTYNFKKMLNYFKSKIRMAKRYGVKKIILDPNVGIIHPSLGNYRKIRLQIEVLSNLKKFRKLGPVMISVPRKKSLDDTAIMASLAIINNIDFIRTHDPEIIREIL